MNSGSTIDRRSTNGIREGLIANAIRREYLTGLWLNASEALGAAAEIAQGRRGMRRAWLNISWTLEEACYAHALEQKAQAITSWRNGATAIVEAVEAKEHYEAALRLYWRNTGTALFEAGEAFRRGWSLSLPMSMCTYCTWTWLLAHPR